jgi:hypothetical protein
MSSVIFLFSFPSTTIMALCFAPPKLSPFQAALQKPTGVPEHHPSSSLRREVFFHAGCAPTSSLPFSLKQSKAFPFLFTPLLSRLKAVWLSVVRS